MFSKPCMVKTPLLVFLVASGFVTNGFADDLTRNHSEEIPKASDVFSNAWAVEALKCFIVDHPKGSYPIVFAGAFIVMFLIYAIRRTGRLSGANLSLSGFVSNGGARDRFKLALISRWGGAQATPMMHLRRVRPPMPSIGRRPSIGV